MPNGSPIEVIQYGAGGTKRSIRLSLICSKNLLADLGTREFGEQTCDGSTGKVSRDSNEKKYLAPESFISMRDTWTRVNHKVEKESHVPHWTLPDRCIHLTDLRLMDIDALA